MEQYPVLTDPGQLRSHTFVSSDNESKSDRAMTGAVNVRKLVDVFEKCPR